MVTMTSSTKCSLTAIGQMENAIQIVREMFGDDIDKVETIAFQLSCISVGVSKVSVFKRVFEGEEVQVTDDTSWGKRRYGIEKHGIRFSCFEAIQKQPYVDRISNSTVLLPSSLEVGNE